jgi:dolichyl-phosphate beta-glucosyltransferase
MSKPNLSIVIPAYQEALRIEKTLDELADYLKTHNYSSYEVIVVVADSPDGTTALAQNKAKKFEQFRVISAGPRVGKGRDVRLGVLAAKGDYRMFMDADLATPLHHLEEVRRLMGQQAPVIIAVRNLTSSHTGLRKLLSSAGNLLVRVLLLPGVHDTQCGFKAFSAEATEELFRRQTILGWGFDMEILAIARMQKYRIYQIEVPDWTDQPNGTFEGQVSSAAIQTLGELLTIVWRRLTGRYRHKHFTSEVA